MQSVALFASLGLVASAAVAHGASQFAISESFNAMNLNAAVAAHPDGSWLVLWDSTPLEGVKGTVYARRVAENGAVGVFYKHATNSGGWDPDVVYNSKRDEYFAVWHTPNLRADYRLTLSRIEGQVMDGTGYSKGGYRVISAKKQIDTQPLIAWDWVNNGYLVVWTRHTLNSEKTSFTKGDLYGAAVTAKAKAGKEFPCWIQPPDGFLYAGALRFNAVTGRHFATVFDFNTDQSDSNRCLGISIESGMTNPGVNHYELAFGGGIRNRPGLGVDGTSGKMLAAWVSATNGESKGYLRELSSWGEPVASAVGALKNASWVQVENYGQGKYIVAYLVQSGSQYQIWLQVFRGTKPLGARGKIASSTNSLVLWDVSYNGSSSKALVTWTEQLSSGYSTIYGRIQSILE